MQLALDALRGERTREPVEVLGCRRTDEGAHRGGGEALELAELREDVGACRHERTGHLFPNDRRRTALVIRIQVREEKADGHGLDAVLAQFSCRGANLILVERREDLSGGRHDSLGDDLAVAASHERPSLPGDVLQHRVVERPLVPADVDDVTEAARGDHSGDRALVLEYGVRGYGRTVEDPRHFARREAGRSAELGETGDHRLLRLRRSGGNLVDVDTAGLCVVEQEVRERSTDVNTDNAHGLSYSVLSICLTVPARTRIPSST